MTYRWFGWIISERMIIGDRCGREESLIAGKGFLMAIGNKRKLKNDLTAFCFLTPNIVGFMIFSLLPVFATIVLSFMDWDLLTEPKFAGLENYKNLLGFVHTETGWQANDPQFWKYLYNTMFFMMAIPISIFGSLLLAIALNKQLKFSAIFRTAYFLPTMCVPVAVFLLWKWVLATDFGLMNWFLSLFGVKAIPWLSSVTWSKPALMVVGLWASVGGFNMVLYLAALQDIPKSLYEAAEIDGANNFQKFLSVTWPMLTPATFFIAITSIIAGFQGGFEAAYIMTQGGPVGSTTTIDYYIYNNAYQWFQMGYAATIACVLFVLVFGVTLINWRFGGKRVHYM